MLGYFGDDHLEFFFSEVAGLNRTPYGAEPDTSFQVKIKHIWCESSIEIKNRVFIDIFHELWYKCFRFKVSSFEFMTDHGTFWKEIWENFEKLFTNVWKFRILLLFLFLMARTNNLDTWKRCSWFEHSQYELHSGIQCKSRIVRKPQHSRNKHSKDFSNHLYVMTLVSLE